jgi:cell division protein FtsI (penicillin-binding protein 3)
MNGDSGRMTGDSGRRWLVLFALLAAALVIIIWRYAEIMLGGTGLPPVRRQSGAAERGAILDRNGRILAIDALFGDIGVNPAKVKDIDEFSSVLAPLLDMSEERLRERIGGAAEFIYLKKKVEEPAAREIEALVADKRFTGLTVDIVRGRVYPEESLAAQIIGFTGDGNSGLEGIEFAFNEDLKPQTAANGESAPGSRVVLTIDANIQYILEEIAAKALAENEAEAVLLTAMDPRSGDILGSASLPGFNPNKFAESARENWAFRPAAWAYEPGSVFKVFSMANLLDENVIGPATSFYCNGAYEHTTNLGEKVVIKCLGAHGAVNARDVIIYSCNAGAAYASDRLGATRFYERVRALGFGSKTLSAASGETAGFLRPPARWSARSKPTISMGQEIAVSAMQMLKAATAVATDGTARAPRLVSRVVSKDGALVREYRGEEPVKVMKAETARMMRSYMRDVTSNTGTGRRAFIEDIPLAVKTGTAEIIDTRTGAYSRTDFMASCMAMLPEAAPQLVLYLTIFKPRGESYYGGRIAAPYIRESAEALVNYLGIPRGRNPQYTHPPRIIVPPDEVPAVHTTVPDFSGYSKREVLPLLLRGDLAFEISGEGWVRRQSPPPGSPLTAQTIIRLDFE